MASSIFGFIIIVATGFLQLTKSQENWTSYRSTAELLQSEYHLLKLMQEIIPTKKSRKNNECFSIFTIS